MADHIQIKIQYTLLSGEISPHSVEENVRHMMHTFALLAEVGTSVPSGHLYCINAWHISFLRVRDYYYVTHDKKSRTRNTYIHLNIHTFKYIHVHFMNGTL